MPITVSELAELTGHSASDNRFIERLHYWTRERLLLPIGKRNPGTGRRRLYPNNAIQQATILNAMTEARVPIEDQRRVSKAVQERLQQTPDFWPRLKEKQPDLWLAIETYPDRSRVYFAEGSYTTNPDLENVHLFHITKLFADLPDQTGGANG